ncbi:hypothetical protein FRC20_000923 [Serendipita sp. 405]|nr:hypothetical protein FRC20_000923 [Serendipita sp. 405]
MKFQHPDLYVLIQLASSFVGDALISGGTVYCLLKSSAHNLRNRSAFTRFARTIALSASLPALLALFNLCIVASNIYFNRWHIVFDFSLSKAFSISFMWTIRIRRKMVRRSATDRMGGNGVGGGGGEAGVGAGVGGAGGGTGCSCSCCGCDYHSGQNRASKRFEFSERGRESRHYGHSPADEYFANPSMFAATMPPQRTQTEHCIEMGQYVKTNHGEVDVIHLDVREPSMPQPTVAKSKESFTRSGSSERSSSSPVVSTRLVPNSSLPFFFPFAWCSVRTLISAFFLLKHRTTFLKMK